MKKYFIIEEWNESDQLPHGKRTSKVTAYGLQDQREINNTIRCMERYSPFDYTDSQEFKTESEYNRAISLLQENGSTIIYFV